MKEKSESILQSLDEVAVTIDRVGGERKIFVLDTNVLLHEPSSMFRFQENIVLIPLGVLDEIDSKKNDPIIGLNARDASQKLEMILSSGAYDRFNGARIKNGNNGILLFLSTGSEVHIPRDFRQSYFDNYLLLTLANLKKKINNRPLTLVTKDRNLRIKCHVLGINAEDYLHDRVTEDNLTGINDPLKTIVLTDTEMGEMFSGKHPSEWGLQYNSRFHLRYNEGAILESKSGDFVGLGIRIGSRLRFINYEKIRVLGMGPKVLDAQSHSHNFEQAICMAQASDDNVKIQVVVGRAGTGKTHIAMAMALEKVFIMKKYDSIKLIKPVITKSRLGEDLGYLPGTVRRKLMPRMRPFVEKLQKLVGTDLFSSEKGYQKLLDNGIIEMMNLADVRGADLAGSVVLFDEAQNANPFQMRTLGTRLGEDSKLIVMGDPTQIDNVYLDAYSNALVNLYQNAKRFPEPFIATVSLIQMVRSDTSRWFEEKIVSKFQKKGK